MNIKAKVFKTKTETKIKGMANLTLDDCFVVKGLKVVEGKNGLFVAMPSQKVGEEYQDTVFPITKEFRQEIIDIVLEEYNKLEQKVLDEDLQELEGDSDELPF